MGKESSKKKNSFIIMLVIIAVALIALTGQKESVAAGGDSCIDTDAGPIAAVAGMGVSFDETQLPDGSDGVISKYA